MIALFVIKYKKFFYYAGQLKNYIGQGEMPIKGMQVHCIKSDTYVPIEKLRDGICNCDIPPHGCRNPNCSDCNDPSDEGNADIKTSI